MPLSDDAAWPAGLNVIFDHARSKHAPFEQRYYGPYDKLLNYCFGDSFDFHVAPQPPPRDDRCDTLDFAIFLVVSDVNHRPVLLVNVQDESWALKAELRYRADKQMRERYALLLEDCALPCLWGLSLLGTSMRLYCGDTHSLGVVPATFERPPNDVLPRSFLAGAWEVDILSDEGFATVKGIITKVHEDTAQVQYPNILPTAQKFS